ncbi:MAG TPA: diguanylate cyclase [Candidatus Rifleibacterium sp.]|nr:diguanylate cyclase [Candidatus Rifleibacterium sp.]HPT46682.1 diguanylate cyclase [Candidatus Rifleibacterium sp.]
MYINNMATQELQSKIFKYLNSIKTKLVVSFLVITLTPLIYISYVMLSNASAGLLNVIVNNSLAHARKASIDLNRFVAHQFEIIQLLARSTSVLDNDLNGIQSLIREFDNRYFSIERIRVYDLQGQRLAVSNDLQANDSIDAVALLATLQEKPFRLCNFADSGSRNPVTIVAPLEDRLGKRYGLVAVELNMLQLTTLFAENVVGNSTRVYLLDENNRLVLASPADVKPQDLEILQQKLTDHDTGVFAIDAPTLKKPLVASLLPVIGHGWKVFLLQDQQEVYQLVETFQHNLYWILFLTMLVAIVIALLISQNIALPILQVTHGANELAAGRYDVRISVANTDEVGQLASNFNYMADSLAGKMEELRVAYAELQTRAQTIEHKNIELDRKVFEVGVLYKIGRTMVEVGLDLERLLDVIIDKAIEAADAKRGSLMLLDENQESLELQRVRIWDDDTGQTLPVNDFKRNINIRPGEGIAGKVLETGEMLTINDPDHHPDFKQYEGDKNRVSQLCCVPLKVKNITFGVINIVNRKDGGDFSKRDTDLLQTMANQAALVLDNTKLFKLAITDGLTGLFMVRHFRLRLAEEIKRSRRYRKIFSLLFFDIDHFKKFNDTYGHQVGDEVLKQVAMLFRRSVREDIDVTARYGGEEMIALLPETDAAGAMVVAERLRLAIAGHDFTGYERPLHVSISIGISEFPAHDTDELGLIRKADTALYECKKGGRNCSAIYAPGMGEVSQK